MKTHMQTLTLRFRKFAHTHDDVPAFHAAYLVGTLLAASILHLGFFAILIAVHMCLDYIKYRDYFRFSLATTFKAMMLESIVDIALFMVSLTIAVGLHLVLELSLLSGLARSGFTILRAIGTIVPKMRILENMMIIAFDIHTYLYKPHADIRKPLRKSHYIALGTIALCSLSLIGLVFAYIGHEIDLLVVLDRELALRL